MTARALIAGIGNIFFGDDGFGVEVVRHLAASTPPDAAVADFGIRGLHLAFELLSRRELVILVDCMPRGGPPGSLYVVEPDLAEIRPELAGAHGMNLPAVIAAVRDLGGELSPALVVGCEPADVGERIGLSEPVAAAVPAAADLVRELVADTLRRKELP